MTVQAGRPADPGDRDLARATSELLAGELDRVRASALAWRNGLGALLAGLIGFSLVKGRSDINQLTPAFASAVGLCLLAALLTGATAAARLMRAAHGRPYSAAPMGHARNGTPSDPTLASHLAEADASQRALLQGVVLSFACVALLTATVGLTWYGPAKDTKRVEVRLPGGALQCGEIVKADAGRLTLRTRHGEVAIALAGITGLAPVDSCPASRN